MIVLDASAALEWLFHTPTGIKVAARLFSHSGSLHAPHLIDLEVTQVLRRYVLQRFISAERAEEALKDFSDLSLIRYPHDSLIPRVWDLRAALTAYDAVYVALAEFLGAALITCDRRLAAAHGHDATIELI